MIDFLFLIPIALVMGLAGLCAFLWSLRNGQYDDLEGASVRILIEDDAPAAPREAALGTQDENPEPKPRA
ncbi:MAG TPA: cbb3-type cytochrome oxidase assembly protein CcoS [Terricaulis sp.]|nr:cbb3-type cytochrome oxidase assembly protein CcoS [Terricaulis sp.]